MIRRTGFVVAVFAAIALAACSDPLAIVPATLTGSWNYSFFISAGPEDQCVGTGTFTLVQNSSDVTGSVQAYTGNCLAVAGSLANSSVVGDSIVLHAGVCTLTGAVIGASADSLSGSGTCTNTFGNWTGTWHAARTGLPVTITVTPGDREIVPGSSHAYQATIRDAAGHILLGRTVTWLSSNTAVATVTEQDSTGSATVAGIIAGSATITAATPLPEIQLISSSAISVSSPSFTSVSSGAGSSCALTAAGAVWCWGQIDLINFSGFVTSPVKLASPVAFSSISVGQSHGCGLTAAGAAYCWGRNAGALGTGDTVSSATPRAVTGGLVFASISAGVGVTCARTAAGAAYCWGRGPLGSGGVGPVSVPTAVSGGIAFASLDSWSDHTCGTTSAGAAWCWGDNPYGALGNGTTSTTPTTAPAAVTGGLIFAMVTPQGISTCGITTAGAAYCWGNGATGALGDGTHPVSRTSPGAVAGGHVFTLIDSNYDETCGMTAPGAVWCWGRNLDGQIGDGTQTTADVPAQVTGGLVFTQVSLGSSFACGLAGGAVYCWGYNQFGQVGDGTPAANRLVPVRVLGQP